MEKTRIERDSMGQMKVPADCMYGAQTARAAENFPVSNLRFARPFLKALGAIKAAAAKVNTDLGLISVAQGERIQQAATEVSHGQWDEQFILDIFQTGSGTSTNMNANEVIAHRANQLGKADIHPNDHVNRGQSSNDVIPSALHISAADVLHHQLIPAIKTLRQGIHEKAEAFADVVKIGRTHLMDATPISLGQELSAWVRQLDLAIERLESSMPRLCELALGGTAVGTGLNTHPNFPSQIADELAKQYGIPFREAENHFEAQSAQDAAVEVSGQLRVLAISLFKIANDVRVLNSGPRCGLGEISIPAVQPGSSIMPGKVNPVIAESMTQVCAQVMGNDACIAFAGASSLLDLNLMLPVISHNLLESETLLAHACLMFHERCIQGLQANREHASQQIEWSMSMVTSLAPVIGYDKAAAIAKQSVAEGKTVRQVCIEQELLPKAELDRLLDPKSMLAPHA